MDNQIIIRSVDKLFTNKIVLLLLISLSAYFLSFAQEALLHSAISGKAVRVTTESDLYIQNTRFISIYNFVGYPAFNFLMTIIPFALLNYKHTYLIPTLISLVFIASFIIINAGRVMFVIILLYLLIIWVVNNGNRNIKLTFKKIAIGSSMGIIALLGMSLVTQFRDYGNMSIDNDDVFSESVEDTQQRVLSYSVLPIVLFDRALNEDYMSKFDGPLLGKATFAGPELYIGNTIKNLFSPTYQTGNDIVIDYIQSNFFSVTPTMDANFAYTGIFFHYIDFGLLGVVFIPLLFGYIYRKIIIAFYARRNLALLALIGFMYFMTMYSIFCCYLIKPWVTFYIPILLYLGYSKQRRALISKKI